MDFNALLLDKIMKPKEKTERLSQWVLNNSDQVGSLIEMAKKSKDPIKATCIESLEFATKTRPEIASLSWLEFVVQSLPDKAPRIKWESAKVIGNIAHLFPKNLDAAVHNLLINTEHPGTVVRWSAAFALGQILKIKPAINPDLASALEAVCEREEKNSIKKIYQEAFKKSRPK